MAEQVTQPWISGFWRRVGALVVDTLLLGVVGFVLGLALEEWFVQIGGWGRLIGFSIALMYFSVGNSSITNGQTLGKRLLKLRVVDASNTPISIGKSVLRYVILAAPFSLNGAQFSNEAMLSFLIYPLSLIIFGGLFSIAYLYIFNRITRQSLHDLAVGTFVVNAEVEQQEPGKIWNVHLIVVALLFVAALIAPAFTTQLAQSEPFRDMLAVQSAISEEPGVSYATVSISTRTFSSLNEETKTTTYVSSQVLLQNNNTEDAELARRLAIIVLKNYPEAKNMDAIQITLTYGYDIGIWSQWFNYSHNFLPEELFE